MASSNESFLVTICSKNCDRWGLEINFQEKYGGCVSFGILVGLSFEE